MPGGVGGQRRKPLPTRLEESIKIDIGGAEHRNIIILSFSASPMYMPYLVIIKSDFYLLK